jgi:hypothetical protein
VHDDAGRQYQATLPADQRRAGGVFYTPPDVAVGLVRVAVDGLALAPPRRPTVCDPACGAGALLLAAADELDRAGHSPASIVEDLIWGADIDHRAVALTRRSLEGWAAARGVAAVARHVVQADGLGACGPWADGPAGGFDLLVGNPPFQSQLASPTARDAERAADARRQFGEVAAPYTDSATLFLVRACELAAAGGRIAMIQPESVLSARDAGPARAAVLARAALVGLWWAGEPVFDAGVRVCAPVLEVTRTRSGVPASPPAGVQRWRGRAFDPLPPVATAPSVGDSWSPLLASVQGTPAVELDDGATLARVATASAGFRDEYYGVVPHVAEAAVPVDELPDGAVRLVTSGSIDPLRCRWGTAPVRFARSSWTAPTVDLEGLRADDARLAGWGDARLVPKVVIAGQTRVLEAAVDTDGCWWPSVPVIAVVPVSGDAADLWLIAAVLSAPAISAWALAHFGGSALSSDAVKVSAAQTLSVPLPADRDDWERGALAAAEAHLAAERGDDEGWHAGLRALGEAMGHAYRVGGDVSAWWERRRPGWR